MLTPDERASSLVTAASEVPGGPWFVSLNELLGEPLLLGPYANSAVAWAEAEQVRRFVAAVIREARPGA